MLTQLLILSRLSIDKAVPLFGESPYAYGEAEASHPKRISTVFGQGGADNMCPHCFAEPPGSLKSGDGSGGTWWIYNDPTWDFSADEPTRLGKRR
mmetsp:Transcript_46253/g.122597  ORF Transcript_46253/g.122597 Transcript_46253/m.122597 type:complete len:95 (+) Transcript_46253:255-539(+)